MVPKTNVSIHVSAAKGQIEKLTSQYEEQETNQQTVAYIQHSTRKAPKAQLADPIQQRIGKHISCARSGRAESSPLPMVIFRAQQEVDE